MGFITALVALVALLATAIAPIAAGRLGRAPRISARAAILGGISYVTFCYYLGNGVGVLILNLCSPLASAIGTTALNALVYAMVTVVFLPVAYRVLWRLFYSASPTVEECGSVAYGAFFAQALLTLLAPICSLLSARMEMASGAAGEALAVYESLGPAYGLFLAAAAPTILCLQLAVARRTADNIGSHDVGELLVTAGFVLAFSFLYQFVPAIQGFGFLLALLLCAGFVIACCCQLGRRDVSSRVS